MKKIKQLKKQLKKKREEEYKIRKKKEHIARQMDRCLDNEKKFSKYYIESLRLEKIYKNIRIEIAVIEGDLKIEAATIKARQYKKNFISFKKALVEDFVTFLNLLDKEKYQEAFEQLEEVESQYNEGSKQFLALDLKPLTSYFTFVSLKRHMAIILDRVGQAHRLRTTRGPEVARGYEGPTKQKVKIVYGIVESIIQILVPSAKKQKKKVKEKQPKKKEVEDSGADTTKTNVTSEEFRHKQKKAMYDKFLKWKEKNDNA